MIPRVLPILPVVSLLIASSPAAEPEPDLISALPEALDPLVVTATGVEEPLTGIPQTIRSYSAAEILESAPRQLTDFYRTNALGQVQDFGPGHSTIFLRGATNAGAGQGWSDASEVSVLINGRSSGTANLGKISANDVEKIEVLRGPSSVLYGSSALGGVINIITKDGESFEGTELTTLFSSFDRVSQIVQSGRKVGAFDYYLQLSATTAGNYDTGRGSSGEQLNTDYKQGSGNLTLGYDIDDLNRVELMFRHDGIYDAGHPGATYSLRDYDDRYGSSIELNYTGATRDERIRWTNQSFYVRDVDEFHWSQNPLIGLIPAIIAPQLIRTPGITRDVNRRELQEWGNRFSVQFDLGDHNTLMAGSDLKYSELENSRYRTAAPGYLGGLIGIPVKQAPLSVDARNFTSGVFLQDTHKLLDDKVTLRLGGRYDRIDQTALPTQNSTVVKSTRDEDVFVYQGGATWQALPWLGFRGNVGTGFLSANPTQLFGTVRQVNGLATLGNPNLKDETSFGWDIGTRIENSGFTADLALYETTIEDYISGVLIPGTATLQWRNADERLVRGLEFMASYDIADAASYEEHRLETYVSGNYYIDKKAVDITGRTAEQDYLNDYEFKFGVRGGQPGKWSADLHVCVAGPAGINAGLLQNANVGLANLAKTYEIPGYAILNFSGSYQLTEQSNLFFGVNNILDKNYSTYFYALNNGSTADVAPYLLPGFASGEGMSSPGREFFGGVTFRF